MQWPRGPLTYTPIKRRFKTRGLRWKEKVLKRKATRIKMDRGGQKSKNKIQFITVIK